MAVHIHFVSGKGGVGKSTAAVALALALARRTGGRTLLVELGSASFLANALKLGVQIGATPLNWRKDLDLALWSGSSCLREYALHFLKSETLYRIFFENGVSRSLIQVAPGLAEIAILGKITSGEPRNVGPKLEYNHIVVDCFASGHFLALLRSPFGLSQAIRFGPMGEQARSIIDVIRDPRSCSYHLVSLAEELPLQECIETQAQLGELLQVKSKIHCNKWLTDPDPQAPQRPTGFASFLKEIEVRQGHFAKQFPTARKLRWVLSSDFVRVAEVMSEDIHA